MLLPTGYRCFIPRSLVDFACLFQLLVPHIVSPLARCIALWLSVPPSPLPVARNHSKKLFQVSSGILELSSMSLKNSSFGREFHPTFNNNFRMLKEYSSGVGTPHFGEMKQRCSTLAKWRLYWKLNSLSKIPYEVASKVCDEIQICIAVFRPKSNTCKRNTIFCFIDLID